MGLIELLKNITKTTGYTVKKQGKNYEVYRETQTNGKTNPSKLVYKTTSASLARKYTREDGTKRIIKENCEGEE